MQQLMWFRQDLRVQDNTALTAAMQRGPTLAVFLLSPEQWREHDDAPAKIDFWLRNLQTLAAELQKLNVPLLIRQADRWNAAPQVIAQLCHQHGISCVHVNDEYGVNETTRDQAVAACLEASDVNFSGHLDQLLFRPGTLLTRSGSYFKVFSQFRKACHQHLQMGLPACLPLPAQQIDTGVSSDPLPSSVAGFPLPADTLRLLWPAGEYAASERLQAFADDHLFDYDEQRNLPAEPGTSQLSPYLAAGVLSPRQCLHAALMRNQGEFDAGNSGVITWINELLWREFYKHILVGATGSKGVPVSRWWMRRCGNCSLLAGCITVCAWWLPCF